MNDKNTNIPDIVYNLLGWIITEDDSVEPISNSRLSLSANVRRKVQSLGQDLIFSSFNGRIKTPKHILLPMAIKSMTGSSEEVKLLNRSGHGLSYTQIEEVETAMAQIN